MTDQTQLIPRKPADRNEFDYNGELVDVTENGTHANTAIVQRILNAWWDGDERAANLAMADLYDLYSDHERATGMRKWITAEDARKAGRTTKPIGADWNPKAHL